MRGQWTGRSSGIDPATVTLNIDERHSYFEGVAVIARDNLSLPITLAPIKTNDKSLEGEYSTSLVYLHPQTSTALSPAELAALVPGMVYPDSMTVKYKNRKTSLEVSWSTPIGTIGVIEAKIEDATKPSEYAPLEMDWLAFKTFVDGLRYRAYIFRGQDVPLRLRTTFHRAGRFDLWRFSREDIPALHRTLSSRTRHHYAIQDADQNGAFLHLAQHYGYPTPLLDWSYSPYVAAFSAFKKLPKEKKNTGKVRIFVFDHLQWLQDFNQMQNLTVARPHFSIMEFSALDNDRVLPQQALSSFTNVDDIETYIRKREAETRKSYLRVIDLPADQRNSVIEDLGRMGISAGSMFPGLDGACDDLKERSFPF